MQIENINKQKKDLSAFICLSLVMMLSFLMWKTTLKGVPDRPAPPPRAKIVGQNAPDFILPDLEGVKHSLAEYKGKFVFLNIWATWCRPCRDEMPSMQKLYDKYKGADFEMLAVSIDEAGEKAVKPFVEEFGLSFPILLDPTNITGRLYETTGVPETFLIDRVGSVIHKVIGPSDWAQKDWFDVFDHLIKGKKET